MQGKSGAAKDSDKSPFACASTLLGYESRDKSLSDRMDLVFQDPDLVPLLVHVRISFCKVQTAGYPKGSVLALQPFACLT